MSWFQELTVLTVLTVLVGVCRGFGSYRDEIPNGNHVAHPCKPNFMWKGVGHEQTGGGGVRNQFGKDFAANNHKWSQELCMADSDGDGETNGFELGDPQCLWSKGDIPFRVKDITHPGVCTPFGSTKCRGRNDWVDCSAAEFECPAIQETDTQSMKLTMPRTAIPAKETTYVCMVFDIPTDQDYHLVATKAEIVNDNAMHHMLLFGCDDADDILRKEPYDCGMGPDSSCVTLISAWTVGLAGDCLHKEFGMKFGKSTFKRMAIQYHWNNPKLATDWFDESGMTIYFTSKLRPSNGGVFMTGQIYLEIPNGQVDVVIPATCSSGCLTAALTQPIKVVSAVNHMHYLGAGQSIEIRRNGSSLRYLTNDENYSYDSPVIYKYDDPIEIRPTDEIITTCHFNSMYSKNYVYNGDGTQQEMCLGFMWFYPAEAMENKVCINYKSVEICARKPFKNLDCSRMDFMKNAAAKTIIDSVNRNCHLEGSCSNDCKYAIVEARKHPCLRGDELTDYLWSEMHESVKDLQFWARLQTCSVSAADYAVPSLGVSTASGFTSLVLSALYILVFTN